MNHNYYIFRKNDLLFQKFLRNMHSILVKKGEDIFPCDVREECEKYNVFNRLSSLFKDEAVNEIYTGLGDFEMPEWEREYYQQDNLPQISEKKVKKAATAPKALREGWLPEWKKSTGQQHCDRAGCPCSKKHAEMSYRNSLKVS
ncbi:MAG: hypothetical protein F9K23_00890 [Bacteroidetes bacterium]|nr:MAG: hypothetical protein F9K23_00890 [Bacteroidota bacterium]